MARPTKTEEQIRDPRWELVEQIDDLTSSGSLKVIPQSNLVPFAYDYIGLTYTGTNLTSVVYKTGGSSGTTVATLTLAYTGSQLDSITKS